MIINEISFFAPELILLASVFILIIFGSYFKKDNTASIIALISVFSFALAVFLAKQQWYGGEILYKNLAIINQFGIFAKIILYISAIISIVLSHKWLIKQKHGAFEYPIIIMLATIGLSLVISANNLLTFYLAVEIASLSMYIMAAYERDNYYSAEAGIKYFILGSLASCIMLFGISLLYGFAGSISFAELAQFEYSVGAITGLVFVIIAFCFKLSAAPFHMWSPDVYQGAPTAVISFFTVAPKIAIFALMARLLGSTFAEIIDDWQQILIFMAIASMVIGAVGGIIQTNIKRLIAYSSISHVGYILLAVIASNENSMSYMLLYLTVYMIINAGLFALLLILKKEGEELNSIYDLAGISNKFPKISLCFAITMFSMAGIPPFLGFFAKALLFMSVIEAGFVYLIVIALVCSVISCFYYIRLVKIIYFDKSEKEILFSDNKILCGIVLLIAILANLLVLFPNIITKPVAIAAKSLF